MYDESESVNLTRVCRAHTFVTMATQPSGQANTTAPFKTEDLSNADPPPLAGGGGCETEKPDTGSTLRDWLTQCEDLHCDQTRQSFIFRSRPPAADKVQNMMQVSPQVCVTNGV